MLPQPPQYISESKVYQLSNGRQIKVTNLTPAFDPLQYERQKEYIGYELYDIIKRIRENKAYSGEEQGGGCVKSKSCLAKMLPK